MHLYIIRMFQVMSILFQYIFILNCIMTSSYTEVVILRKFLVLYSFWKLFFFHSNEVSGKEKYKLVKTLSFVRLVLARFCYVLQSNPCVTVVPFQWCHEISSNYKNATAQRKYQNIVLIIFIRQLNDFHFFHSPIFILELLLLLLMFAYSLYLTIVSSIYYNICLYWPYILIRLILKSHKLLLVVFTAYY